VSLFCWCPVCILTGLGLGLDGFDKLSWRSFLICCFCCHNLDWSLIGMLKMKTLCIIIPPWSVTKLLVLLSVEISSKCETFESLLIWYIMQYNQYHPFWFATDTCMRGFQYLYSNMKKSIKFQKSSSKYPITNKQFISTPFSLKSARALHYC